MTARRRLKSRPLPNPWHGNAAILHSTARLVRAQLRRNRADLAPLRRLATTVGVTEEVLREAVAHAPDLGICHRLSTEHVWYLPPLALAAGFEPSVVDDELVLRLTGNIGNPSLHVTGRHLGPAPDGDSDLPEVHMIGVGPLGYTVARLLLMADRWLTPSARSEASRLFELIAHTWRTSPRPVWSCGRLQIHQSRETEPPASRLELVVWADERGALQLINLYPAGTHRTVFDMEVQR